MFPSMKMEEYMESQFFLHFLSKTSCQKYSAWVLGGSMPSSFCSVMYLSEEIYKFYTKVFPC